MPSIRSATIQMLNLPLFRCWICHYPDVESATIQMLDPPLSIFFKIALRLKDSSGLFYDFIASFKQSHLYNVRVSYPAIIGYIYCSIRNVDVYSGNPIDRCNESCDHILAVPAYQIIYYECCLSDVFTPAAQLYFSNRRFTHM